MHCADLPIACQLERIADQLTGFDWNNFASTLLATLVGAGVAAGVSFWLAARERPQPMWRTHIDEPSAVSATGTASLRLTLSNIGDGAAYHPRVTLVGAGFLGDKSHSRDLLEPGDSLEVWFSVRVTGERRFDHETFAYIDTRVFKWPASAEAVVEWHQPPQRHRIRKQRFTLENPHPQRVI